MQKWFPIFLAFLLSCQLPSKDLDNMNDETFSMAEIYSPTLNAPRDPAQWPFSSDSPWNTPIGNGAIYQQISDPCTQSLIFESDRAWINSEEWSHPIYHATKDDPLVPIFINGVEKIRINIPANTKSALPFDTDSHLHIIDPSGHSVVEMWRALPRSTGGWNADYYFRINLHGSGVLKGGARAYGGSAIGGLIRKGELAHGIRHALAIAQPYSHLWPGGPVWPANKIDEYGELNYFGHYPMGQLAAIPPNIDLEKLNPPLSRQGLIIGRAMQDFGVYNVDASRASVLYVEPAAANEIGRARRDLPRLWSLLRCVSNNSQKSVGGGGNIRRAPKAPRLLPRR